MRPRSDPCWLGALRRYLAVAGALNLVWEFAHMPLYTLWRTGAWGEIAFAALHCTGGDLLIATAALVAALVLVGSRNWPERSFGAVAGAAIAAGLGYTLLSEHLNTSVRATWAYSEWMPTLPWLGTGLSPVLQWLIVPAVALAAVRRSRGGIKVGST